MAFAIRNVVALLMIKTLCQATFAVVYEVGDSAGWTLPIWGNVDYDKWASSKKFHVGDVLGMLSPTFFVLLVCKL